MTHTDEIKGKVLRATRKTYTVAIADRILECTIRGKLVADKADSIAVKVGDNVLVSIISEHSGLIEKILPRKSQLSRKIESRAYQEHIIAANIDQLLIVMSTKKPRFNSGLLDRYLAIASRNKIGAIICINKIDLAAPEKFKAYYDYYPTLNHPLLFSSVLTGQGISQLKEMLDNRTSAIVGQSGVGKSSLVKAMDPELDIRIGEVSERTRKGQHTTTAVQLYPLSNSAYLIDTPGIRELGFWGIYKRDLQAYFVEIRQYAKFCQFADCHHIHEPGCAVKMAVDSGEMLRERYENYLKIHDSLKSADYE